MRIPVEVCKEIKRIITFETNSMGEPMAVVVYKKKGVTAPAANDLETAKTTAKSVLEKIVDSQIQAANEFKALNEKAGSDWLKAIGKNISIATWAARFCEESISRQSIAHFFDLMVEELPLPSVVADRSGSVPKNLIS